MGRGAPHERRARETGEEPGPAADARQRISAYGQLRRDAHDGSAPAYRHAPSGAGDLRSRSGALALRVPPGCGPPGAPVRRVRGVCRRFGGEDRVDARSRRRPRRLDLRLRSLLHDPRGRHPAPSRQVAAAPRSGASRTALPAAGRAGHREDLASGARRRRRPALDRRNDARGGALLPHQSGRNRSAAAHPGAPRHQAPRRSIFPYGTAAPPACISSR